MVLQVVEQQERLVQEEQALEMTLESAFDQLRLTVVAVCPHVAAAVKVMNHCS